MAPTLLFLRQNISSNNEQARPNDNGDWWQSDQNRIINGAILFLIFFIFFLYFLGGYLHAQRRIRKGLPPLGYHRWFLPSSQRRQLARQPHSSFQQQPNDGYGMNNYPPPPPAYSTMHTPPPVYQAPEDASKTNPVQTYDVPPPGPPPSQRGHDGGDLGEGPVPQAEPTTPLPASKPPSRFKKLMQFHQ